MLFTGFMLTESGPKVLEYNVRFGDPETEALMLLLADETDLAQILLVSLFLSRAWSSLGLEKETLTSSIYTGMCVPSFRLG